MMEFNPDARKDQLYAEGDARLIVSLFEAEIAALFKSSQAGLTRRKSMVETLVPPTDKDDEGIGKDEEDTDAFVKAEKPLSHDKVAAKMREKLRHGDMSMMVVAG